MALRARSIIELLVNAKDQASARLSKIGGALTSIASKAKLAGAALVTAFTTGLFTGGIRSAAQFEKSLDRIQAVTRASAEEMRLLEEAANKAGTETKFTADEAAGALENLVRSGKSATDAVALLPQVLSLATAETLDLADAADFVTKTLAQFNLGIDQTQRVVDVLVATSQSANTNVAGVASALRDAGIVAEQAGLSLEQTAASIGVLANAGLSGEKAGVALRNVILQLQDPASKAREELAKLGIRSDNLAEVLEGLSGTTKDTEAALLAFGREPAAAIRTLVSNNKQVEELAGALKNVEGRAAEAAKTVGDNLQGATTRLGSAWDSLTRAVAKPFIGPIIGAIDSLAVFVQRTSVFIGQLIEDIKSLGDEAKKTSEDIDKLGETQADEGLKALRDTFAELDRQITNNRRQFQLAQETLQQLRVTGDETSLTYRNLEKTTASLDRTYAELIAQQKSLALAFQNEVVPAFEAVDLKTKQETESIEKSNKARQQAIKNIEELARQLAESNKERQEAIEAERKLGDNIRQTASAYAELTEEQRKQAKSNADAVADAGFLADALTIAQNRVRDLSTAALDAFNAMATGQDTATKGTLDLNEALDASILQLQEVRKAYDNAFSSIGTYARVALLNEQRALEVEVAFRRQAIAANSLVQEIAALAEKSELTRFETGRLAAAAKQTTDQFDLLGDSELKVVQSAIDSARLKLIALKDEARAAKEELEGIADSLRDSLATDEEREERRFREQLRRIKELAEFDRNAALEAERLAEQFHKKELERIRERLREQPRSDVGRAPTISGGTNGTSRPTGSSGVIPISGLAPNFFIVAFDERQKEALARDVRQRLRNLNRLNS